MEYTVKFRTVIFPEAVRTFTKRFDRNQAISDMRDLVFFQDATEAWIEADGDVVDRFHFNSEIAEILKKDREAELN